MPKCSNSWMIRSLLYANLKSAVRINVHVQTFCKYLLDQPANHCRFWSRSHFILIFLYWYCQYAWYFLFNISWYSTSNQSYHIRRYVKPATFTFGQCSLLVLYCMSSTIVANIFFGFLPICFRCHSNLFDDELLYRTIQKCMNYIQDKTPSSRWQT